MKKFKDFKFNLIDGLMFTAFIGLFSIGFDKFMAIVLSLVSGVLSVTGIVVPVWLFITIGVVLTVAFIVVFSFKKEGRDD